MAPATCTFFIHVKGNAQTFIMKCNKSKIHGSSPPFTQSPQSFVKLMTILFKVTFKSYNRYKDAAQDCSSVKLVRRGENRQFVFKSFVMT